MRSIRNKRQRQRTVLAEGLEPIDTQGKREICSNMINQNYYIVNVFRIISIFTTIYAFSVSNIC